MKWQAERIIGQKTIQGKLFYMVEWMPSLAPKERIQNADELLKEWKGKIKAFHKDRHQSGTLTVVWTLDQNQGTIRMVSQRKIQQPSRGVLMVSLDKNTSMERCIMWWTGSQLLSRKRTWKTQWIFQGRGRESELYQNRDGPGQVSRSDRLVVKGSWLDSKVTEFRKHEGLLFARDETAALFDCVWIRR